MTWREAILKATDPVAQRYTFARYVLGEDRLASAAIAGAFASCGPMDEREYDHLASRWASAEDTRE